MRVTLIRDASLSRAHRKAVSAAALGPLLRGAGDRLGVPARASLRVRLTGDDELRRLNGAFLGADEVTDVLAFPDGDGSGAGDIAISVDRAAAAPDPRGELRLLAVHGLLHCLGHDHATRAEAEAMTGRTRELLPDADVQAL